MLQKDEARQLFVSTKKCASEEDEEQAKSRRYHTILHKQSVNNSIMMKKSIIQSNNYDQKHGNMIPYLKQRGLEGNKLLTKLPEFAAPGVFFSSL